jgi:hypothetical protein
LTIMVMMTFEDELKTRGYILGYAMCVTRINSKTILKDAEGIDDLFLFIDRLLESQGLQSLTNEEKNLIKLIQPHYPENMAKMIMYALKEFVTLPRDN